MGPSLIKSVIIAVRGLKGTMNRDISLENGTAAVNIIPSKEVKPHGTSHDKTSQTGCQHLAAGEIHPLSSESTPLKFATTRRERFVAVNNRLSTSQSFS